MPTRKTIFWLLAAACLYLVAWNIGGGWLYSIIAILIAFPLASLLLSRFNTGGLSLAQDCRDRCVQGDDLRTEVVISNHGRLPRFFISLTGELAGGKSNLLLVHVPGRGSQRASMTFRSVRRGIFAGGEFSLASKAPAGLARSRRRQRTTCPVVVYPHWYPLPGDWRSGQRSAGYAAAGTATVRTPGNDYLGVRDYRPEDSPRSIHWKSTARCNRLVVTEYARQAAITPAIIVDRYRMGDIGPAGASSLEVAVTLAASLVQREAAHNRRFAIGTSPADAAAYPLSSEPEAAMLMLAGLQADGETPLDLDATASLPLDVTPVVIATSLADYADIGHSALWARYPGAVLLLVDGRSCEPTSRQARRLMGGAEIASLAVHLADSGCRSILVDPSESEDYWLASL